MVNANPGSATMLDGAQAHALALAMYNAVAAQQQGAIVRQAATTMVCAAMLSLGIAETAEGAAQPPAADADAAAPQAAQAAAAPLVEPISPLQPPVPVDPAELRGKAYQSVAQATALAIQDAADYLRNVSTMSSTALGVAMAQYLATADHPGAGERYAAVIAATQQMMAAAVTNFEAMGASAENLLKNFPEV